MTLKESLEHGVFSNLEDIKNMFDFDRVEIINPTVYDPLNQMIKIHVMKYGLDDTVCISSAIADMVEDTDVLHKLQYISHALDKRVKPISSSVGRFMTPIVHISEPAEYKPFESLYSDVIKHLIAPEGSEWKIYFKKDSNEIILESARGKFTLDRSKLIDLFISTDIFKAID